MTDDRGKKRKGRDTGGRRSQGSGSVYQRGSDGLWVGVLNLGWVDGKRKRKYITGRTESEVVSELNKILGDQARGLYIPTQRQTVAQYLEHWLEHVVKPGVRPRTYESYESICRVHLIPALGRHRLDKLSAQHVNAMVNQKKTSSEINGTTALYIRNVLRNALNQAMKWDLVGRNVATLVKPPEKSEFEPYPLTTSEAERFLATAAGSRLEALYTVAIALGLRQSEAFGLRWQDVDLENKVLHVRKQLQWMNPKPKRPVFSDPKTRRGRRSLPIPDELVADIKRHHRRQLEEQLLAGDRWRGKEWDLVFCTTIGTPLDPSNVTKDYKALLEKAGLDERRYHDLRHSCGSILHARKVPARTIMEIMGHSQISTTMNTYVGVEVDSLREATALMGGLVGSKTGDEKVLG